MYIVTGGAGFIGSVLLRELNRQGVDRIIVADHLGNDEKWRNLVKAAYVDYVDRAELMALVRSGQLPWKVNGIVHLGACSSTTESDAGFLMENNFHYSRDLCAFAMKNGIRFINASSAATYGAGEHGFGDAPELVPKLRPLNMYAYSKQLFDLWLLRKNLTDRVASLKFFNVYGPNEYHKGDMRSVARKLWEEISASGNATLFASANPAYGDGEQKRDFVYVKDCARLISWLLLEKTGLCGIRNVGTGQARSFRDLALAVFAAMGRQPDIAFRPMPEKLREKYQYFTCADMGWLQDAAYPYTFLTLEQGVKDYVGNYLETADEYV